MSKVTAYTVEVYKKDTSAEGRHLVEKHDMVNTSIEYLANTICRHYPWTQGYQLDVHETFVTKKDSDGVEFTERYDTV